MPAEAAYVFAAQFEQVAPFAYLPTGHTWQTVPRALGANPTGHGVQEEELLVLEYAPMLAQLVQTDAPADNDAFPIPQAVQTDEPVKGL
jgi:hypothetical protein